LWYLNGWLNEAIARTPVALTSLLLIPTVFALGRRMCGGRDAIGLAAAGFVAVNGFFVAYARQVENQSLIVFWGALGMWFAYRYYKESLNYFLLWLALVLAVGLIAHPDMLLYLPVFGYMIWLKVWPKRAMWRQQWPWLVGAGFLFVGLVALFYLPYLTDPNIGLVYQYFGEDRIGTSLLYNRVANVFDQDKLYASRYHMPVLLLLLLWLLGRNFAQWGWRGWTILTGLVLAMISTVVWPEIWVVSHFNLAFVPCALLTLIFIFLPRTSFEIKSLFLWFVVPLGALVFLAQDAADHVQIAYPAWALLSALALVDMWDCLSQRPQTALYPNRACPLSMPPNLGLALKTIIVVILIAGVGLILFYQYLAFNSPVFTYWQAKIDSASNPDSLYNKIYGSIPRPRKIFSNPRLGGWKVVGYLWETGALSGDFRSINESFAVPIWYTFQTPRSCYEDPQHYWLRRDWQGWPDEEQQLIDQGYTLTRVVLVDREPKLHLYEKNAPARLPEMLAVEDYRVKFDHLATPARFAQDELISWPTSFNFGDKLLLRGVDLPPQTARPGDLLPVTVYWESLAPMESRYRGFVHLIGPEGTRWGQHDDDPACRLLTTEMRPGQQSSRQFRLPVDPATPPGTYNVVFGLYQPDTLERLAIWDNVAGQAVGDSLILGQVTIGR
jgi:4-amino-4-deoxy-L-arabinose transferase-like glycosyltransferase